MLKESDSREKIYQSIKKEKNEGVWMLEAIFTLAR